MKILVYGINYFPELTGIGKYTGEMCEWLAARGHDVEVITAMPYYPRWKVDEAYKGKKWFTETINKVKVNRSPIFVTQKVTSKTRIVHEVSFLLSTGVHWIKKFFSRYDVIISIYPPLGIGVYPTLHTLFHKTPVVFHVQDLQVDAAKELGMIKNKWVLNLFFKAERYFINKATRISSISPGMKRRLINKGFPDSKYINLPNWVDTNFIKPLDRDNDLKQKMGLKVDDKIVFYSGNLGEKQGLELIISVAEKVQARKDLFFIIAGEGAAKKRLVAAAEEKGLENVIFAPLMPYDKLPTMLNLADIHLILQKKGASDLVLPSKLNTILAAGGVSVVSATEETSLYEIVANNDIGIVIEPDSEEDLRKAIEDNIDKDNKELKQRARDFAIKNLNIDNILGTFEKELHKLKK